MVISAIGKEEKKMPGPQFQRPLLNHENVICGKGKHSENEETKTMRRIRVLCSDPYATDSSSEDEADKSVHLNFNPRKRRLSGVKRVVAEFDAPFKPLECKTSFQGSNGGQNPNKRVSSVKKRKWGKSAAEISAEEESTVERTAAAASSSSCASECSESLISPSSPSSVLDISASSTINGSSNSASEKPDSSKSVEVAINFLEEPLVDIAPDFLYLEQQVFDLGVLDDINIPLCGIGGEDEVKDDLSSFDLEFDPEVLSWINF